MIPHGLPTVYRRPRRGFTLVELILVVMILAILAALVIPRFTAASDDAYRVNAEQVEHNLRVGASRYLEIHKEMPKTFVGWVDLDGHHVNEALVSLSTTISKALADPTADVLVNDTTLRLVYRNGLIAEFTINDDSRIDATYTDP